MLIHIDDVLFLFLVLITALRFLSLFNYFKMNNEEPLQVIYLYDSGSDYKSDELAVFYLFNIVAEESANKKNIGIFNSNMDKKIETKAELINLANRMIEEIGTRLCKYFVKTCVDDAIKSKQDDFWEILFHDLYSYIIMDLEINDYNIIITSEKLKEYAIYILRVFYSEILITEKCKDTIYKICSITYQFYKSELPELTREEYLKDKLSHKIRRIPIDMLNEENFRMQILNVFQMCKNENMKRVKIVLNHDVCIRFIKYASDEKNLANLFNHKQKKNDTIEKTFDIINKESLKNIKYLVYEFFNAQYSFENFIFYLKNLGIKYSERTFRFYHHKAFFISALKGSLFYPKSSVMPLYKKIQFLEKENIEETLDLLMQVLDKIIICHRNFIKSHIIVDFQKMLVEKEYDEKSKSGKMILSISKIKKKYDLKYKERKKIILKEDEKVMPIEQNSINNQDGHKKLNAEDAEDHQYSDTKVDSKSGFNNSFELLAIKEDSFVDFINNYVDCAFNQIPCENQDIDSVKVFSKIFYKKMSAIAFNQ